MGTGADLFGYVNGQVVGVYAVNGQENAHFSVGGVASQFEVHGQLVGAKIGAVADGDEGVYLGMLVQPVVQAGTDG